MLGWSVKMRPMQEVKLGNKRVGTDISSKPWKVVSASSECPPE